VKLTQHWQAKICIDMLENMLGKYYPTARIIEREWLPEVGCEIDTGERPSVDIHPAWQYSRTTTEMELDSIHLHEGAFLGPHSGIHATFDTHPGEMSLGTDLLHDTQGHRAGVDQRQCYALRFGQQVALLDMIDNTLSTLGVTIRSYHY
jgi:hypothetical protein